MYKEVFNLPASYNHICETSKWTDSSLCRWQTKSEGSNQVHWITLQSVKTIEKSLILNSQCWCFKMAPWLGSTFYTVYVQKVKLMFSKRSLSESTQSEDKDMKVIQVWMREIVLRKQELKSPTKSQYDHRRWLKKIKIKKIIKKIIIT